MQVVVVLVSFSNMLQKKLFLEEEEGVVSVHNYSTVLKRFFFVTFFCLCLVKFRHKMYGLVYTIS